MKYFFIFLVLILPLTTFAAPIVPCGIDGNNDTYVFNGVSHKYSDKCGFDHLIIGINNIINFLLMITGSIAALVFAAAGFMVLTAGSNEGQVTKAKEMSWSVVKGFALMISAWLLVKLVLTALGVEGAFNLLK